MKKNTKEIFSLVVGGPFWRLQQRLGLLGPDRLPPMSTALLFAAIAWLPPALLSLVQGDAWSEALGGRAFLFDFTAYARFTISIFMLVLMERIAEGRIAELLQQISVADLVPPAEQSRYTSALQRADRLSSSALAEAIILGIAYVASVHGLFVQVSELKVSWVGSLVDGQVRWSMAGWWALLLSLPLFWFLVLRWFWRFVVWTRLLWDVANLNLRLVATHPDQCGGIGFMSLFPSTFAVLVFALSCVTASAALEVIWFADWNLKSIAAPFLAWVALVLLFFVGPLCAFAPALLRLKKQALLTYGVFAIEHNRAFEKKWVQGGKAGKKALGTSDASSLAGLATAVQLVRAMRAAPISVQAILPLLIAIGLPWLAVVATQVPFMELLTMVMKALL